MKLPKFIYRALRDDTPEGCRAPFWMACAYWRYEDRRLVMVAWPLHYLWQAARWLEWHWNNYRHKPSWLDAEIDRRAKGYRQLYHDSRARNYELQNAFYDLRDKKENMR